MLSRLRTIITLCLIGALPFHAFFVTIVTKLSQGPGHAPQTSVALWKEGLLALILFLVLCELIQRVQSRKQTIGSIFKLDWFDGLILALLNIAIVVSIANPDLSLTHFLYGFKYDFLPLVAFVILRRVSWSEAFYERAIQTILIVGGIIALYGIDTYFLPDRFFYWLGYSDLHSLYVPNGPLAAFQQIGGTAIRRIQSTMSGPNQLGLWLLIPWSIAVSSNMKRYTFDKAGWDKLRSVLQLEKAKKEQLHFLYLLLIGVALILTFSRAAWVSAVVITVAAVSLSIPRQALKQWGKRLWIPVIVAVLLLCVAFPAIFLRQNSSRAHVERPIAAIKTMIAHPFGWGLSTAGPASNRRSDACVYLEPGADPSWARPHTNLCVFVGEDQVQPRGRTCNCPYLPENWYLQVGVEMGILGLILFIALTVLILKKLIINYQLSTIHSAVFLSFLGVSVAALFLHSWEDAAVAYSVWVLLGTVLSSPADRS